MHQAYRGPLRLEKAQKMSPATDPANEMVLAPSHGLSAQIRSSTSA
eukprot:CAMPEP_0184386426 /NCGR_PEP_ID=MMETSP0007-20130409/9760_1 /TAXON_ID=97485 /ORGANISM="Prymnesium parvum, Strain Texoma1" /LENGTH=45 /DNA_ID= /DNA_START= /DNA_END= /DNA_ORIENTATION=